MCLGLVDVGREENDDDDDDYDDGLTVGWSMLHHRRKWNILQ